MTETPELDKLAKEKWKTELIHEFLEFCAERQIWLNDIYDMSILGHRMDKLLADFIGIDLNVVEAEKRQLLEEVRQKNVV